MGGERAGPPLALYLHVPWCLRKCPYCDFHSRELRASIPEGPYVDALLQDLELDLARLDGTRPLISVFIGGGTPSLLSGAAVARLLEGIRALADPGPEAEITLEANPGMADARRFAAYREAGVNRLSIGAQSFSADHLARLGRIHGPAEVNAAVAAARSAGFANLNLDLMYGLPGQTGAQARADLEGALALEPEHLSYYQLTLGPGTAYWSSPPPLPDDDLAADMQLRGAELLAGAGYAHYEVSAYARPGRSCRHNLNYWTFGDYLGIGAAAHGKLTRALPRRVERYAKRRLPGAYLDPARRGRLTASRRYLSDSDLVLEFAMNALRLRDGFDRALFEQRTGLPFERIAGVVEQARDDGLLEPTGELIRPTELGWRFLNDLIVRFVKDRTARTSY